MLTQGFAISITNFTDFTIRFKFGRNAIDKQYAPNDPEEQNKLVMAHLQQKVIDLEVDDMTQNIIKIL